MNLMEIEEKEYKIPINVSKSTIKRYKNVIENGYAKYLYAIAICGGGCMLRQFIELIKKMDKEPKISFSGYSKRARIIIEELERLGFIETGYLNRNKYILLKHPSVALSVGDYKTYKRVSARSLFKSDKFIHSITKMQGLLDFGFVCKYSEMWEQLINITKQSYEIIIETGNAKKYDISLIEEIIQLADYKKITKILDNMPEHKSRLGVVRLIWTEIASLFRKLSQKGCLISANPLYSKVFINENGFLYFHYAPIVVIYDSIKSIKFYEAQKTFLSNGFYEISGNNTLGMKEEYNKSKTLGFKHFNRVGYTVIIVGTNKNSIVQKKEIIDEPFNNGGIHTPMIKASKCYITDVEKYINHSNITNGNNTIFEESTNNLEKTIERLVSVVNEA